MWQPGPLNMAAQELLKTEGSSVLYKGYATRSLYFTCPQGLRTDHPVLVYKTCEFSGIVLRLFSCLPPRVPTIEPISPLLFFILFCLCASQLLLWISHLHLKSQVPPHCFT